MKRKLFKMISYFKDKGFGKIFIRYFILLFVCLVLPVTIINFWFGHTLRKEIKEEFTTINEIQLENAYESINAVVQAVKENAYDLSNHESVQYLVFWNSSKQEYMRHAELLLDLLKTSKRLNDYIENICIYFEKSDEVFSCEGRVKLEEYEEREWLEEYGNSSSKITFQSRKKNGRYPYLLTVTYPINVRPDGSDGMVVIDINVESLAKYLGRGRYKSRNNESVLIIMDAKAETLIYSDEYRLYEREEEITETIAAVKDRIFDNTITNTLWNKTYVLSGYYAEQEEFIYICMASWDAFAAREETLSANMRNGIAITAVLCVFLAFLLAVWVYKPIRKTVQLLDELSLLTGCEENKYSDEILIIQRSILGVKTQYDNLNDQMKERIINLHRAQMYALQAQINPHFLYNTLETIGNASTLLLGDRNNKIKEMIYSLGKLLRISLKGESYLVPLQEELDQVMLYAKLLDFRFRDRIRLHIEIPEDMIQEKVLKLTLQPLIENAVEHGFKDKRVNGEVWIKGEKRGDVRYIHVIDNGKGLSEQECKNLQLQMNESAIIGNNHLGLRNVNQRLKLIFGEEYGLVLSQPKNGGFCVTVFYTLLK